MCREAERMLFLVFFAEAVLAVLRVLPAERVLLDFLALAFFVVFLVLVPAVAFLVVLRVVRAVVVFLRVVDFERVDFFRVLVDLEAFLGAVGTFAPFERASESPIAIACLRLLTFAPLLPLFNLPLLYLCIASFTDFCDFLLYFAISISP